MKCAAPSRELLAAFNALGTPTPSLELEPPAPLAWARRTADLRDGHLRCIHGHRLGLHGYLMAWDGYRCEYVRPGTKRHCGSMAFYVRGHGHRVFAVEATAAELTFIRDSAMVPAVALAWLGAELPADFTTAF